MKKNSKQAKKAGRKAVVTKAARTRFKKLYGDRTATAIRQIVTGQKTKQTPSFTWRQLAAYKANLTRGTYFPYAYLDNNKKLEGTCNWR
jgi:hypothetical protein